MLFRSVSQSRYEVVINGKRSNEDWLRSNGYGNLVSWFNEETKKLTNYNFRDRVTLLVAGHRTPPLCQECNFPVRVDQKNIHTFCSQVCKNKSSLVKDKTKSTILSRYGGHHYMKHPEVLEKYKKSALIRYGVEDPRHTEEAALKRKNTNLLRYGFSNPMKSDVVRNKAKETTRIKKLDEEYIRSIKEKTKLTCQKKYGVDHNFQINLNKEALVKLEDRDWLLQQYNFLNRPSTDIADEINCYYGTVLNYLRKYGCDIKKSRNTSKFEQIIINFLNSIGISNIQQSNRKILQGQEIDIFLPEHNFGIEVDGVYWHQDTEIIYHQNKTLRAKEKGVELIHITDLDLIDTERRDKIFMLLKNRLLPKNTVYGRNTTVKETTTQQAKEFLEKYHIQGYCKAKVKIGLYSENKLVMIATFDKPRFSKDGDWELIRLCSAPGTQVVGGVSKIISYFRERHSGPIVSYVDLQYFSGKGFLNAGWKFVRTTPPGYYWVNKTEILSRYQTQKSKLKVRFPEIYTPSKTEAEIMHQAGYMKYNTCGNLVLVLD